MMARWHDRLWQPCSCLHRQWLSKFGDVPSRWDGRFASYAGTLGHTLSSLAGHVASRLGTGRCTTHLV
jgi:hypothetical protein